MDKNAPATKKDLDELESRLKAEWKTQLAEVRESITEQIRDSQTEILRRLREIPIRQHHPHAKVGGQSVEPGHLLINAPRQPRGTSVRDREEVDSWTRPIVEN